MSQNILQTDERLRSLEAEENVGARKPDYPVHPLILNRWSPRSYSSRPVSDEQLFTVLEAARWAPSSSNQQPWRFYVARSEREHEVFRTFIKERNRKWADKAPVLILLCSSKLKENGDPNAAHAFDAGTAWGLLALQARLLGLSTRAIGGFDRLIARKQLRIDETIEPHAVIALGYRGERDDLDETFRPQEQPNGRRPLADSILEIRTPTE